jgi:triphosphoribosyl-dephospho-CoA synthetase
MIDDRDVWQATLLIVKRYGDDAMLEASERADQLLEEGDMAGAETWHRTSTLSSGCRRRRRRRARRRTRQTDF